MDGDQPSASLKPEGGPVPPRKSLPEVTGAALVSSVLRLDENKTHLRRIYVY